MSYAALQEGVYKYLPRKNLLPVLDDCDAHISAVCAPGLKASTTVDG
jgi:hypothetical protein